MSKQFTLFATVASVLMLATATAAQQPGSGTAQQPGPATTQSARPGAQSPTSSASTSSADKTTLAAGDEKFIKEAAMGGQAEVELGRLAAMKASNPDVKQFGQRMVDDHGKANMELMDIARRKNVTVATELSGKHKSEYDKLAKLSGAEFDRAYVKLMVDDHKKDVAEFQKLSTSAKDSDLRSFVSQTLPTLQQHLTVIEGLSGEHATSTSGAGSNSSRPRGTSGSGASSPGTSGSGNGR
jgi:putative membrane protein